MTALEEKVIVALDFQDPKRAYEVVETLGERVLRYKLGPQLFLHSGPEVVRFLHAKGKRVFVDLKLYDTPNVVADTITQLATLGVEFASVHVLGGRTMLQAAGSACRGSKLRLLGVTLLTSQGAPDSYNWGWPETEAGMVHRLAGMAMECRLSGILCSPQELRDLRPRTVPGFLLVTPGIRIPGLDVFQDDQRRVASPTDALEWGADMLVVGRPLTQSPDPNAVLDRILSP